MIQTPKTLRLTAKNSTEVFPGDNLYILIEAQESEDRDEIAIHTVPESDIISLGDREYPTHIEKVNPKFWAKLKDQWENEGHESPTWIRWARVKSTEHEGGEMTIPILGFHIIKGTYL